MATKLDEAVEVFLRLSPDAVVVVDPAGRIRRANELAEALLGHPPGGLDNTLVDDLVPAGLRGNHAQQRRRYLGDARRRPMGSGLPLRAVAADGSEIPVDISLSPIEVGDELHVAAVIRDLRDVRQTLTELNQLNDRLQESVAFQQRFTSMVSHELRTPLTLVLGLAETLLARWDDIDRDKALPYLRSLASAANRQKLLLDDLLDVSRIQEGRVHDVETAVVRVREVVDDALTLVPGLADDVVVDMPSELTWRCDPLRASQIVVNLLSNARKYGKPPYEVTALQADDRTELRVRDHGKGVPADFEASLFERFSQAGAPQRLADGVGLGLHIVQWLITVQQGRLWYERPEDGPGAVFAVSLPTNGAD